MTDLEFQESQKEAEDVWKRIYPTLREDQIVALKAFSEITNIIIESKEPLAVAMFWIGEADLLKDAPITWISNLKKERLRDLMQHGITRINNLIGEKKT